MRSCAFLVVLTAICLGHSCANDFVNIDDDSYVTQNPHLEHGLTFAGLKWAWTDFHYCMWNPLTRTSFLIEYQIHGLQPWGYHLTNVILHIANVLILFGILRRLTGSVAASLLAAALWAVHPLRVESVTWITERKDVLSGLFGFLAIAAYLRYTERPSVRALLLVAACWTLSLLAKPMMIVLPCLLLLLDLWPLGRTSLSPKTGVATRTWRQLFLEKAPLFLLMLVAAGVTALVHPAQEPGSQVGNLGLGHRLANAVVSCVQYLIMTAAPCNLCAHYPHPLETLAFGQVAASLLVLAGISGWTWSQRQTRPWLLVGWLWYLGSLAPVLGLRPMGGYARADRYTYLPHVGLVLALAGEAVHTGRGGVRFERALRVALGAAVLVFGLFTWRQVSFWSDSETLWRRVLHVTTGSFTAHFNLAAYLAEHGRFDEALEHYEAAARIRPELAAVHLRLAELFELKDMPDEVARCSRVALALEPDAAAGTHSRLGLALIRQGKLDEAEVHCRRACTLEPDVAGHHNNLGACLDRQKRWPEAAACFRTALEHDPNNAVALDNLDVVLARQ